MSTALSLPRALARSHTALKTQRPTIATVIQQPSSQRRAFLPGFPLPSANAAPQRFTENRTLPFGAYRLAALIKDIDAYSSYLPYCVSSVVTETKEGLPTRATLAVGFGPVKEEFASKVSCLREIPSEEGVKAVSWSEGGKEREDTALYTVTADGGGNEVFERCYTRWSVKGLQGGGSRLGLDIEFQFKNPLYAALAGGVLPKVGAEMIAAFEERAGRVLDVPRRFE